MADMKFNALIKAIRDRDLNKCKELLNVANGTLDNLLCQKDSDGDTALLKAVKQGDDIDIVQIVLDKTKECPGGIHVTNNSGRNAINAVMDPEYHRVYEPDKMELVEMIIKSGCDLNKHDNDNVTPLYRLVDGQFPWVKNDPLETEALLTICKMMLDTGCDVNAKSKQTTVLHRAVKTQNIPLMKLLLDYGADPKVYETTQFGPDEGIKYDVLHTAAHTSPSEQMKLILESGRANLDSKNSYGRTGLMMVLEEDPIDNDIKNKIEILMAAGCDPSLTDNSGKTILHILCENQRVIHAQHYGYCKEKQLILANVAETLLKDKRIKALVNRQESEHKSTPLHIAVKNSLVNIVQLLLSEGASVVIKNKYGQTVNDIKLEGDEADKIGLMLKDAKERNDGGLFVAITNLEEISQLLKCYAMFTRKDEAYDNLAKLREIIKEEVYKSDPSMKSLMSTEDKEILQRHTAKILDDVEIKSSSLIDYLFSERVLTRELKDEIFSKPTQLEMARKLVDILPRRGNDALQIFISGLRKSGHGHLADALDEDRKGGGVATNAAKRLKPNAD
ncbi:unnamed protein product [Owenia fusiformis]|uniref:Uncharacterized protein n=1 Tax=Owenia fusiformis TaxID=6347 RepID=A0A8J1YA49_OWEFU|nr:unnamed protein product [Owenia fusiformis]